MSRAASRACVIFPGGSRLHAGDRRHSALVVLPTPTLLANCTRERHAWANNLGQMVLAAGVGTGVSGKVCAEGAGMVELLRTENPVLISALIAALDAAGIDVIEFDGPIADIYGAVFPRRLMVHSDDLRAARAIAEEYAPELLPPA